MCMTLNTIAFVIDFFFLYSLFRNLVLYVQNQILVYISGVLTLRYDVIVNSEVTTNSCFATILILILRLTNENIYILKNSSTITIHYKILHYS